MSKRKVLTPEQKLRKENIYDIQPHEIPPNETHNRQYVRVFSYMLTNKNFIKMSTSAKILLIYMKDWANSSEEYAKTKKFDFSSTLLHRLGIMARSTCIEAFEELLHYGFIKKENNASFHSGEVQKWSFDTKWYQNEITKFKKKRNKKDV